jgi:hypothetical protein
MATTRCRPVKDRRHARLVGVEKIGDAEGENSRDWNKPDAGERRHGTSESRAVH